MSSSTQSEPSNAATVRSDVPCLARDRALPSIPSNARAHEVSLEHQLGALDSSFQRPVLTIQTKRNLVRGGKFLRSHHTYAEPPDLSRNRQSLPPPYAAVDPNAPPRASRTVRWVDRPIDNPRKRHGNVGTRVDSPLDASSNTSHVASTRGQAPGGRVRCFFRRCKKWLQGARNK
ncbi:hypothetical protein IW261DRAFT_1575354 [Armillaria novae-zelandiae]|uniref:Uncharacterized protein n=1 Tax=Armillaria novae-zelandiae TaxID=153914 RepID=A0AA39NEG8_9AGAR|nr:hypothetical protein IW261DRAFT_1575354 [Armillaria novae-zelandiae]